MTVSRLQCQHIDCMHIFHEDRGLVRYEADPGPNGPAGGYGSTRVRYIACPKCGRDWLSDYSPPLCAACHDDYVEEHGDRCNYCIAHDICSPEEREAS